MNLTLPAERDATPCERLRTERRRLLGEVQRLSWLRRLVQARSDLEVARLTGLDELTGPGELDPLVRSALVVGEVRGPELLRSLSDTARGLDVAGNQARAELAQATEQLLDQLAQDPARCLGL
ncbi:hypothetical protein [Angustibacter sp. Root456]|uniref:hypothetical protein n=1 Tax=Angustibacter sp. Root456 TaxID=1736539 RepID=UPI0006FFE47A|nr:hypothetical protein [Angustibacter sp. Root456]KQX61656.1 hypothetical protein ASD06_13735 [Angustibacter sp. Root456]